MSKLLLQFPTFKRPEKFLDCISLYLSLSSGDHDCIYNINCDTDDETMRPDWFQSTFTDTIRQLSFNGTRTKFNIHYDNDTNKIGAMNAHIDDCDFDIVVGLSDDMIPVVSGWDKEIVDAMFWHFPSLDGCVHFNDGHAGDDLITLSILGKKMYERYGYIYHPDYKSLYCDNEFTETVKATGKYAYIDKEIIRHEHYAEAGNKNSGDFDEAAQKTLYYSGRDQIVFNERRKRGFPKARITND